jgi:hypothetical protein
VENFATASVRPNGEGSREREGELRREQDQRTGRPLVNGRDSIEELSDDELEVEVTIAAAEPSRRRLRLDALLLERARRRGQRQPQPA